MGIIPGEGMSLVESDLLAMIGRTQALLELEQKKRTVLIQAYNELKHELETLKEASVKKEK